MGDWGLIYASAAGDGDGDAMTVYTLLYVLKMLCTAAGGVP